MGLLTGVDVGIWKYEYSSVVGEYDSNGSEFTGIEPPRGNDHIRQYAMFYALPILAGSMASDSGVLAAGPAMRFGWGGKEDGGPFRGAVELAFHGSIGRKAMGVAQIGFTAAIGYAWFSHVDDYYDERVSYRWTVSRRASLRLEFDAGMLRMGPEVSLQDFSGDAVVFVHEDPRNDGRVTRTEYNPGALSFGFFFELAPGAMMSADN